MRPDRGFTLIELLVVISIIGVLASIVLAIFDTTTLSAQDAVSITELQSIQTAIESYYLSTGKLPDMFDYYANGTSTFAQQDSEGNWIPAQPNAWECDAPENDYDTSLYADTYNLQAWNATMQELVDAGYLSSIPHSHPGSNPYCYFNFDQFNTTGTTTDDFALIATVLKNATPSYTGIPPSFRWSSDDIDHYSNNKCSSQYNSTDYCLQITTR